MLLFDFGVGLESGIVVVDRGVLDAERVVAVAASGSWVVAACATKTLRCFDLRDGRVTEGVAPRKPSAVAIATDILVVACGGELHATKVPDLGKPVFCLGHTSSVITCVAFSYDERLVATCDRNEKIRVSAWPQTALIEAFCLGHTDFVSSCVFAADRMLASCGGDGTLRLWDATTGSELFRATVEGCCTCLAATSDALALGTAKEGIVRIFDIDCRLSTSLPLPTPPVDLRFLRDDTLVALVSDPEVILVQFDRTGPALYEPARDTTRTAGLVQEAKARSLSPPLSALHAYDDDDDVAGEPAEDDDDAEAPPILRKHALDRKYDVSLLGPPQKKKNHPRADD
ncbi:hypothetical protein CTAYLR_003357 [Chrysophaeum taylorii]|uniref:tRNA (guanine-N(7)-)-methyltransferase non-catalytic subunit n=1 Tax=Chrysophaeum taylorii TaxID=2483200 RepID=A0AAD7UH75_9STRA|nr:hypothetical protein CTAYLR_003357 [Chrysophaeum taylorii]